MALDLDDEIVQDFLLEAGEILEQLATELVDLEQGPEDRDRLNSIFRGFHTIKGGSGFLGLDNLVEVSHKAEDVFDLLRRGQRRADAALMDVMLRVLDALNDMFDQMRSGSEPAKAPHSLLTALVALAEQQDPSIPRPEPQVAEARAPASVGSGGSSAVTTNETEAPRAVNAEDPTQEDPGSQASPPAQAVSLSPGPGRDEITEAEFEQLLDELYGNSVPSDPPATHRTTKAGASSADWVTEDEFQKLLDGLHDPARHGGAMAQPSGDITGDTETAASSAPHRRLANEAHAPAAVLATPADASIPESLPAESPMAQSGKRAKNSQANAGQADSTVRVETSVLDRIMNMVGELVLIRNRITTLEASIGNEEMSKTASILDVVTSDLQAAVMKTRMQPVKKVFGRFQRVVRDLARNLGKQINLELQGEDTDLDKNLVEALADPLVHLVRNAVDHGIEMPDLREARGKPRVGTVRLAAEQEGDHILITISDDGAGMDPEVLRRKAFEKGLMDGEAAARLDEHACYELIFAAGFSTKTEISDVSGRGVGMDVVKTRINQLNGTIAIDSQLGRGTSIYVKLPLTLAIVSTLMVVLGNQIFALPLVNVSEIIDFDTNKANLVDGQEVLVVRGRALPLFYLGRWLIKEGYGTQSRRGHVVIVTVGTQRMGLLVDQLIGQEEVVIKPLGALLQGTKGLAGATITGDGRIALILDLPGLIGAYARRM